MDPFFDSLATALGNQAGVTLSAAAGAALEKIRGLLRRRGEQDAETRAALEAAEDRAAGPEQITALAQRLDRVAAEDEDFRQELHRIGDEVHQEVSASGNRVVFQNTGNVKNLMQANEIHGNINFS